MPDDGGAAVYVSIIIANYNGLSILPSCLNSVESQTYTDFETIVVDDCSKDASMAMLESSFPWVRAIRNASNLGASETKNVGLRAARHEIVAFLDNDAVLAPDWLESMVRMIGEDREAGALASKILFSDNRQVINSAGGTLNLAGYGWDRGIFEMEDEYHPPTDRVLYACSAAMLARRSILEELGGFDGAYEYPFEDADLGWRLNLAGYPVRYNPDAVAYHNLSATMGRTNLRKFYLYERNRLRSVLKNFETSTLQNVRGELFRLYMETLKSCLHIKGTSLPFRVAAFCRLLQAIVWNFRKWPAVKEAREKVQLTRKLSDIEMVRAGLIRNAVDFPITASNSYVPDYQPRSATTLKTQRMDRLNMHDGCVDYLGGGWYNKEFTTDYTAFRWTKEEAVCYLLPSKRYRNIVVKTVAANPLKGTHGRIKVNGEMVSEFYVMNRNQTIEAALPPLPESGVYEVRIIIDNPYRPAETFHNPDKRKLGIAISKIYLS
ncbi:MAG: glycosyltransferase family 2 protein [Candidatus Geothermincolia bacterium]